MSFEQSKHSNNVNGNRFLCTKLVKVQVSQIGIVFEEEITIHFYGREIKICLPTKMAFAILFAVKYQTAVQKIPDLFELGPTMFRKLEENAETLAVE